MRVAITEIAFIALIPFSVDTYKDRRWPGAEKHVKGHALVFPEGFLYPAHPAINREIYGRKKTACLTGAVSPPLKVFFRHLWEL